MREPTWPERHLAGFRNRLKDPDRIKDKIAESLAIKGRTVTEAVRLVRLRNFWPGDQYEGISSLWRDPAADQLVEVQFHTDISYHAMMFTAGHA
jgi:hypothetical protein